MSRGGLLFGANQGGGAASKYLVEFRAGKMTQKGKLVSPDKRKGSVFIQQTEDSLIHFCWKDRTSGTTEDDLIMFPGDAEFEEVTQCTTGRVFVLKFKSNNKRCFYWMQEPKTENDDDFCAKVNQYLNDPTAQTRGGNLSSDLGEDTDLQSLISGMSQSQLMQLFGGLGGVGNAANISALLGGSRANLERATSRNEPDVAPMDTEPAPAAPASSASAGGKAADGASSATGTTGGIRLAELTNILNKVNSEGGTSAGGSSKLDLSGALSSSEALEPLIGNPELMARVKEFLPPSEKADTDLPEQIKITVKSPQFQQAVSMFSAALSSGQLGPLMTQFGMSSDVAAAAASGDMDSFVKALQASKATKKDEKSTDAEMKE